MSATGRPHPVGRASDAGHRIYTPAFLRLYDPVVLGFYSRWIWRCPAGHLRDHYARHLRRRHLDIGPGTGYFLDHAELPARAEVTLLDANRDVLTHAARRLQRLAPRVVQADVCADVPISGPFDSAAMNHVLHCLPGPMSRKAAAVANVAALLAPDGLVFGATVLGEPRRHTRASRAVLNHLNRTGVFDNRGDTGDGLRTILESSFVDVEIQMVGSVAVFTAVTPAAPRPRTAS